MQHRSVTADWGTWLHYGMAFCSSILALRRCKQTVDAPCQMVAGGRDRAAARCVQHSNSIVRGGAAFPGRDGMPLRYAMLARRDARSLQSMCMVEQSASPALCIRLACPIRLACGVSRPTPSCISCWSDARNGDDAPASCGIMTMTHPVYYRILTNARSL